MERPGILKFFQLLADRSQLVLYLCLLVLGELCGLQKLLLNEEALLLGQPVEELGQIGTLLRRDLCRGGIGSGSAITESEYSIRASDAEIPVNGQTSAICLQRRELSHQVLS